MVKSPGQAGTGRRPFAVEVLERSDDVICALDADLRISYVNPSWLEFARRNGSRWDDARWLGYPLLDAISADARRYYSDLFARALAAARPLEHSYECSTATTYRRFRMRVSRTEGGLLVAHSLSRQVPLVREAAEPVEARYRSAAGIILQCSHCRRVRRTDQEPASWEWVPELVLRMPALTSHGLCALCADYYYGGARSSVHRLSAVPGPAWMLVASRDTQIRELTARILRSKGHRVAEARDADETLLRLEADPFDLVVIDPGEPGMNDVASAVRRLQPSARLVAVSSAQPDATLELSALVQKPFTRETLLEGVRAALELRP